MYVQEKAPGEVGQITKLSEAIRAGAAMGIEENGSWSGCALGTAARGMGFQNPFNYSGTSYGSEVLSFLQGKGFSMELLSNINKMHCSGVKRLQIAAWLEVRGK